MRVIISFGVVICLLSTVAFAQDDPVANFGTVGGSNLRTNQVTAPYIFGDGSNMYVKARVDMTSIGLRRVLPTLGLTFDTDGSFYMNTIETARCTNSGVTKINADGTVAWTNGEANGLGSIAGGEVIVGTDYIYSYKLTSSTAAVYGLNKSTGATEWSTNLTSIVAMCPVLSNGYLYGVESNGYAFAVNASTGALAYEVDLSSYGITTQNYSRPIFIEDAFGTGEDGMFWKGPGSTHGISFSSTTATYQWSQAYGNGGYWNYNDVYDPVNDQIYRRMGDNGTPYVNGVQGIDPTTGDILWTWEVNNQGFESVSVAPGGGLLIGGGQGSGKLYRVDTTKTYDDSGTIRLDETQCFVWTITDQKGEWAGTNRTTLVTDPTSGEEYWILGSDTDGTVNHTLMAIDPDDGTILWTWTDPLDPDPTLYNYGGSLWRQLSVSPNGDLVYLMFEATGSGEYGLDGTIMIVSSRIDGDTDLDGDVDGTDLATLGINWDPAGTDKTWAQGDFDGDGDIDGTDLAKIGLNWNPAGLGTVPEPVTMSLFGLGGLALLRRRRK